MEHLFGINDYLYRQRQQSVSVMLKTSELINGHMMLAGMSGTGKSFQLSGLIGSGVRQGIEFDVFDPHSELDLPGTRAVVYSEATRYGYNPLVLNTDAHSGGVQKRIAALVRMINATSRKLGPKQESVLRNLLEDVYYLNGIYANKPASWQKQEIDEATRERLLANHQYADLKKYYPTIEDVISLAERKIKCLILGLDNKSVTALDGVTRSASSLHTLLGKQRRGIGSDEELERMQKQLQLSKDKFKTAFDEYLDNIETGREIQDMIRYSSAEVLQSTLERIKILNASGIFRSNAPPFGENKVRVHQIKSLSEDEQKMFVYTRMEEIFRRRMDKGVCNDVEHVIIVDEASRFFVDDSDNIMNVIAKEARKFGLALWCASQSPTHFADDFLTNCGTTVLLGLHSSFWDKACRQMRIEQDVLKYIKPGHVAAIKLQKKGDMEPRFANVLLKGRYAA